MLGHRGRPCYGRAAKHGKPSGKRSYAVRGAIAASSTAVGASGVSFSAKGDSPSAPCGALCMQSSIGSSVSEPSSKVEELQREITRQMEEIKALIKQNDNTELRENVDAMRREVKDHFRQESLRLEERSRVLDEEKQKMESRMRNQDKRVAALEQELEEQKQRANSERDEAEWLKMKKELEVARLKEQISLKKPGEGLKELLSSLSSKDRIRNKMRPVLREQGQKIKDFLEKKAQKENRPRTGEDMSPHKEDER
ncbi:unnamed protein product [Amoebophrya sp. A25]|nr:unnamed protein product [Amoebophrya sp. A25]|eukprot:GSA25T00009331001.1